jgi:hypothetical protein
MSEYLEDCCFNDIRDQCPLHFKAGQCPCRCHEPTPLSPQRRRQLELLSLPGVIMVSSGPHMDGDFHVTVLRESDRANVPSEIEGRSVHVDVSIYEAQVRAAQSRTEGLTDGTQ